MQQISYLSLMGMHEMHILVHVYAIIIPSFLGFFLHAHLIRRKFVNEGIIVPVSLDPHVITLRCI